MTERNRQKPGQPPVLNIDDGVAMFMQLMRDDGWARPAAPPPRRFTLDTDWRPEPPEVQEAFRWEMAERIVKAICAAPQACPYPWCRRSDGCKARHALSTRRYPHTPQPSRRTPGADALRYAMAHYVNKLLALDGEAGL